MTSVFQKAGRWYLRVKDGGGIWRKIPSSARTKTEARRMAEEYGRRSERQRLGLEALPPEDGGGTLAELLKWWLDSYSRGTPSHERNVYTVRRHLTESELGSVRLASLSSGQIEAFLQTKSQELSPQSLNHLRRYILTAFNCARRAGRYLGPNPAAEVRPRRVPKRAHDYLRTEEVAPLLEALAPRWKALFATAIFTGLRKGELLGLRKTDVDLVARQLIVARSYDRDTTKGGRVRAVPIASELVPYLEAAFAVSPSRLVFPAEDGSMMRPDVALESVLRRAMGRAGIVTGWRHICRRQTCGHQESAPDAALRSCPRDGRRLWPKPVVRPLRFHDCRHSTASLLMMAGANPAAVQRILGHSSPAITTGIYGHLAPSYLLAEADRLAFGLKPMPVIEKPMGACLRVANHPGLVPPLSPNRRDGEEELGAGENRRMIPSALLARSTGLEPVTSGVTGRRSNQLN